MTWCPRRIIARASQVACAALLSVLAQASFAASCSIASIPVSFGVYDVFAASPNNNGVGTLTINCQGGVGTVTLSTGQSNTYAARLMKSGANPLNYNLYTSAARNVVWGDGTGVSSVMTAAKNGTSILSIFGQIPAGQDAAFGMYSDSIIAIVSF